MTLSKFWSFLEPGMLGPGFIDPSSQLENGTSWPRSTNWKVFGPTSPAVENGENIAELNGQNLAGIHLSGGGGRNLAKWKVIFSWNNFYLDGLDIKDHFDTFPFLPFWIFLWAFSILTISWKYLNEDQFLLVFQQFQE